jgi:hypothetical protein
MKEELNLNENLLLVYFNITISCKQFNSNKILYLNNSYQNPLNKNESISSSPNVNIKRKDSSQESFIFTTPMRKLNQLTFQFDNLNASKDSYDADEELTESFDDSIKSSPSYSYDLILFPHIIEICLNYIIENIESMIDKQSNSNFSQSGLYFLKRILHLLQSCNFNIQIIINYVSKVWIIVLFLIKNILI